jgi:hypothetical protein
MTRAALVELRYWAATRFTNCHFSFGAMVPRLRRWIGLQERGGQFVYVVPLQSAGDLAKDAQFGLFPAAGAVARLIGLTHDRPLLCTVEWLEA